MDSEGLPLSLSLRKHDTHVCLRRFSIFSAGEMREKMVALQSTFHSTLAGKRFLTKRKAARQHCGYQRRLSSKPPRITSVNQSQKVIQCLLQSCWFAMSFVCIQQLITTVVPRSFSSSKEGQVAHSIRNRSNILPHAGFDHTSTTTPADKHPGPSRAGS